MNPESTAVFFNCGFDIPVLKSDLLYNRLDKNMVIDVQWNNVIKDMSVRGYCNDFSLEAAVKDKFGITLPKDTELRTSYRRDGILTKPQIKYAAMDGAVTLMLGIRLKGQPTEHLQAKACYAFRKMSRTGIKVDMEIFKRDRKKFYDKMLKARDTLLLYGYIPGELIRSPKEIKQEIGEKLDLEDFDPTPTSIRMMFLRVLMALTMYQYDEVIETYKHFDKDEFSVKDKEAWESYKNNWEKSCSSLGMEDIAYAKGTTALLETISMALDYYDTDYSEFLRDWKSSYDKLSGWGAEEYTKPVEFMQRYLRNLEHEYGIEFDRTDSTIVIDGKEDHRLSFGKDDMYKLDELEQKTDGKFHDKFLYTYLEFAHARKIYGTYYNPSLIDKDGRVHPFVNLIVRNGRTSFSRPNTQNPPKDEGVREQYTVEDGFLMGAIDYSTLELCTLAETCFQRFGYSVLMDIINSGLCPHRWYASYMTKLIELEDLRVDPEDQEKVKWLDNILVNKVDKLSRDKAKAVNFGLPGGLGVKTFRQYARNTYGVIFSEQEAKEARDIWFQALPEMNEHMKPTPCDGAAAASYDEENKHGYVAETLTGRVRNRCSFTSACNHPFSGLAADGGKNAVWYTDKAMVPPEALINFVHDEIMFRFQKYNAPERLLTMQKIMEKSMQQMVPHVKIKTEGVLMERWYKEADPVFDEDGMPTVWTPDKAKK